MKILHVDTGREWRGGQRQCLTLHKLLLLSGYDSTLLCRAGSEMETEAKKLQIKNIITTDFNTQLGIYCKALSDIIKQQTPNIVHSHDSKSLSLLSILKNSSFKLIETRRVSYPIGTISRLFKYRKADAHVGVSEEIQQYLSAYFSKTVTINSCLDISRFQKDFTKSPFQGSHNINILFVGAFSAQKGIDVLIDALPDVIEKHPNVMLHLVGGGQLENIIKQKVSSLGLDDHTVFYGHRSDIELFYKFADFVIVPSVDGEGSSGVIKEGLATGKTVIASDITANMEIITDNTNGFLFENRNSAHLADKIILSIENEDAISLDEINKTIKRFTCETMAEKYITLYNELV